VIHISHIYAQAIECYSAIKKRRMKLFHFQENGWNRRSTVEQDKPNITCACSFAEPRHKMIWMIIIMKHEFKRRIA
jgi:hypothetical protein